MNTKMPQNSKIKLPPLGEEQWTADIEKQHIKNEGINIKLLIPTQNPKFILS